MASDLDRTQVGGADLDRWMAEGDVIDLDEVAGAQQTASRVDFDLPAVEAYLSDNPRLA